ncbi:hypothetical protein LCGC14_0469770 [marine sediment metagenome]|uniref:Uncharacterized protein n=1 Tax=marine sediment metagenome TaxID=412755 RepID=A0A0F9SVH4_9ZZZZ
MKRRGFLSWIGLGVPAVVAGTICKDIEIKEDTGPPVLRIASSNNKWDTHFNITIPNGSLGLYIAPLSPNSIAMRKWAKEFDKWKDSRKD